MGLLWWLLGPKPKLRVLYVEAKTIPLRGREFRAWES